MCVHGRATASDIDVSMVVSAMPEEPPDVLLLGVKGCTSRVRSPFPHDGPESIVSVACESVVGVGGCGFDGCRSAGSCWALCGGVDGGGGGSDFAGGGRRTLPSGTEPGLNSFPAGRGRASDGAQRRIFRVVLPARHKQL